MAEPDKQPSEDDEYVSEQLQLMGLTLEHDTDRNADKCSESEAGSSEGGEEERGLEAFEDVLSSWLTAAHSKTSHALMKAQASLPLRPRIAGNPSGGQSTLARIQEQQQQLMHEEAKAAPIPGKKSKGAQRELLEQARADADREDEEEPELPTGIEGWKDVLSGWMTTAGVAASPQHAQHAALKTSGKASRHQVSDSAKAEAPSWLADISSDEDEAEEDGKQDSVIPPRTASTSEPHLKTATSQEEFNDTDKQDTQASAASLSSAAQQLPQHAQQGSFSNAPPACFPPSPLEGYSLPSFDSVLSTSGISSQDLRLEGDLLNRARSDPAALWPHSAPGFPPRTGQEHPGLPAVATSVPAPVYSADQGLPPQVRTFCVFTSVCM